jgi:predicted alpha/beta hydrolase
MTQTAKRPDVFKQQESVMVDSAPGVSITVRIWPTADQNAPVVLILPAMAMKAKHYMPLIGALNKAGVQVATCDLRAQGEASPPLADCPDFGYREMLEEDLPAVIGAVRERFSTPRIHLFGHSLGGQLALLRAAAQGSDGAVASVTIIGTGTVFWRAFGPRRWIEALAQIQWIGLVARVRGSWPGGILIPGPMAGGVMIDWSRHSLTAHYRPKGTKLDYDALIGELSVPVLAISLADDTLGPKSNVDFLVRKLRSAVVSRWHIEGTSPITHRGHVDWLADSRLIAPVVRTWIDTGELDAPQAVE